MSESERLRVDVWLWRARFAKTRSAAAALVTEGAVRLVRAGGSRALDKAAHPIGAGDVLAFAQRGKVRLVRIEALGVRRGPPAEARALYMELADEPNPDIAGFA